MLYRAIAKIGVDPLSPCSVLYYVVCICVLCDVHILMDSQILCPGWVPIVEGHVIVYFVKTMSGGNDLLLRNMLTSPSKRTPVLGAQEMGSESVSTGDLP